MVHLPPEIRQLAMEFMTLPTLKMLASTNSFYQSKVNAHLLGRIYQLLRIFGLAPMPFLAMLKQTNSIISGSGALVIVLTWSFTPGDLDIYTPASRVDDVVEAIKSEFDYADEPTPPGVPSPAMHLNYHSVIRLQNGHRKIQIIASTTEDATKPLRGFHSSPVMNFLSGRAIFCAYPVLLEQRKGIMNCRVISWSAQPTEEIVECVAKYERRGFNFEVDLSLWPEFDGHVCGQHGSCPYTRRTIDDKHVLLHAFQSAETMVVANRVYQVVGADSHWIMKLTCE